ncbi:hypothetical protein MPTK1_2g06110 [Marchantia polymorpha subsp. ruderalis]|nr:hypothetical protein MARPO_0021s0066 [Marchantia polymorpha]BBN01277.1 hypothetical protein Mp_2g06110 [Marchantia polymorpha subsp. ruderalis]|eukprot:PTQ44202.1 hypothetical protein MARPO_0021s0066 [Marchantia polymorpha]
MGIDIKAINDKSTSGKQQNVQDDGTWGPVDIVQRAVEIFRGHACTFTWIQLTLVFPFTVLGLWNQYYIKKLVHDFMPVPPPSPPSNFQLGGDPTPDEWQAVVAFIVLLLLGFAFSVNVIGALFFAVGSIYSGKTITFKDVLAALPNLWNGLIVTGLWGYVFFGIVAVIVFLLGSVLMTFASVSFLPLPIVCLLTFTVAVILMFFVCTSIQMANGVTVFQQICGLPAFSKGLQLLKSKWCVALGLATIFAIPQAILAFVVSAATLACAGVWAKYLFLAVLANLLSLVIQFSVMSSTLLYFSCNQAHQQTVSVDHFSFSQNQFESGYQRIGGPLQSV